MHNELENLTVAKLLLECSSMIIINMMIIIIIVIMIILFGKCFFISKKYCRIFMDATSSTFEVIALIKKINFKTFMFSHTVWEPLHHQFKVHVPKPYNPYKRREISQLIDP